MKRGLGKKGLSPVVASVLLIMLVIVLAGIIFTWARGFIKESIEKNGQPIESVCEGVNFEMFFVQGAGNTGALDIVNRGNVPIHGFEVKQIVEGESQSTEYPFAIGNGEAIPSQNIAYVASTEKFIVFPKVLGNVKGKRINRPFTCLDHGKSKKLQ